MVVLSSAPLTIILVLQTQLTWDEALDGLLTPGFAWGLRERPGELALEFLLDECFWEACCDCLLPFPSAAAAIDAAAADCVILVMPGLTGVAAVADPLAEAATEAGKGPIRVDMLDPEVPRCRVCLNRGKLLCKVEKRVL